MKKILSLITICLFSLSVAFANEQQDVKTAKKEDKQSTTDAKPACCNGKSSAECHKAGGMTCTKGEKGKACCAGEHKEENKK